MIKKVIWYIWGLLALVIVIGFVVFALIANGTIGYMPPIAELQTPTYKFATQLFSEDGELLGTWSLSRENRLNTTYEELPVNIIQALIATEDIRFAEHSGIDGRSLARAIIKRGLLLQKSAGGGSTITQQLAKLLYTEKPAESIFQRLLQKPIEWVIAVKLERYYTKEEIITMYLNKFDFLNNAVGIKTAARTYFSTIPKDLTIEESATLVGMCKNPTRYNPRRFNQRSRERRNVVLNQMYKAGYLTETARDSLQALPLTLHFRAVDHKEGLATYFREYLRTMITAKKPDKSKYRGWQKQKFYEDSIAWVSNPLYGWCTKNNHNIYTDGLKIYTTINAQMQRYAEEAVIEHLGNDLQQRFFKEKKGSKTAPYTRFLSQREVDDIINRSVRQSERYNVMRSAGASAEEIKKAFNTPEEMTVFSWQGSKDTIMTPLDSIRYYKYFLRTGFMSMDPYSGQVKAYVGGPYYANFQYDMAMVGRRQVGSTIKPFLYTLAMESGFSPCDEVRKIQQTYLDENGEPWTPRNTNKDKDGEMVTLKWALTHSDNYISAYLMDKLSPYSLKRLIQTFGVLNQQIDPVISLCLGPCDISVGEMVSAYTAFVNKGIRVAPLLVTRIEDKAGNVLESFSPQMNEVMSAGTSYKMLDMLEAVVNEGTGTRVRRIYGIDSPVGGKTGTTDNNSDGWFIGFTPQLVSGVWVGGEDRDIHFDTMANGQGASMALPIWSLYMKKVLSDKRLGYNPDATFQFPANFHPCNDSITNATDTLMTNDQIYGGTLDDVFN